METYIHNLLTLGEDVFVSWASNHLQVPDVLALIPANRRDPLCPNKWTVTLNQHLAGSLAKAANEKKPS
jgi:hypothetical protein